MTNQQPDSLIYKRKHYTLIDSEKDKLMDSGVKFTMPFSDEDSDDEYWSSDCQRGFSMRYFISRNQLYGIRVEKKWLSESPEPKSVESDIQKLMYTGSCIIARHPKERLPIEGFHTFLFYRKAYELHFTDGKLDEVHNLREAISSYRNKRIRNSYLNEFGDFLWEMALADRYLKYRYDTVRSYVWRYNEDEEDDEDEYSLKKMAIETDEEQYSQIHKAR